MGTFSIWHWLIVLVIVLVIFGTKKLRNAGGDLGSAVKNFKDAMKDGEAEGPKTPAELSQSAKSDTPAEKSKQDSQV